MKTKGARLSMELTIAGRYMVYAPTGEGVGVSRRLEDKERDRLRKEAKQLDLGGGGAIIRTAAHGATRADFERELQYLFKLNDVLEKRVKDTPAPALVFQEADLSVRVVRDIFSEHFERAIVDDERQHHRLVVLLLAHRAGAGRPRRALRRRGRPAVRGLRRGPGDQRDARAPGGPAVSGGYLIIDYAEALTVIDVNTGSFTGKGKSARLEDTITKTNLEAADEVVRQLRLRDIGGIIVIDFIDMARSRNRDAVLKVLRKALDEDRTKTFVVEISPLGLVEMTRQNVTDGVREIMTKPCPVCSGEGVVKSEETIAIEFARHLRHMVIEAGESGPEAYLLRINPKVTAWFIADGARELHALEGETGRYFHFEGSDGLPLDYFAVTMEGTRAEIEEHAVPFRAGEEVHVHLVEPHMYNDDDAVAKVDGYLIDVVNGVAFVGEKKLVRIEEAGRTIARAVLVGADAEAAEDGRLRARLGAREGAAARAPLGGGQEGRGQAPRARGDARPRSPTRPRRGGHRARRRSRTPTRASRRRAGAPRRRRRSEDAGDTVAAEARTPAAEEAPKPAAGRGRARKRPAEAEAAEAPSPRPRRRPRPPARAARASVPPPRCRPTRPSRPGPGRRGGGARAQAPLAARQAGRRARARGRRPRSAEDGRRRRGDGDDALSSRPRRRGRRGGRRRSRAKAQADAEVSED